MTEDCFVDPQKTKSTISNRTFAVSKWIDMGRVIDRPPLGGRHPPLFWVENLGFNGIEDQDGWGVVLTRNNAVVNAGFPPGDVRSNDIEVDAPDQDPPSADYIPQTNEVAISFKERMPSSPDPRCRTRIRAR